MSEQMSDVVKDLRITIRCTRIESRKDDPDFGPGARHWRVTLVYQMRRMTTTFSQGSGHKAEPTAADVLSCLASDASGVDQTFESWCGDLGYDSDSRKALSTYEACKRMRPRLERLLGNAFERVCAAEH